MREILFRGKRTDNGGQWVYGYFFKSWGNCYILHGTVNGVPVMVEVVPETIGQFTGLKDKNGTNIFEGDILRIAIIKDSDDEIEYKFGSVEFSTRSLEYIIRSKEGLVCGFNSILNSAGFYEFGLEVVGNIHDNKDLLYIY